MAKTEKPDTTEPEKPNTAAADAAVAEATAEPDDDKTMVRGTFAGVDFAFKEKRLDSIQFRRLMQRGRDLVALEWLLGTATFNKMVDALADDDGDTDTTEFLKIYAVLGEAAGTGNSSSSSG